MLGIWGGPQRRNMGILSAMRIMSLAAIGIAWRENTFLISLSFFVTGISFVFIMGLNRVIWQTKAKTEMLGRVFSLQIALGVISQSAGILLTGPLAENVFEPLMMPDGALANTFGTLLGVGARSWDGTNVCSGCLYPTDSRCVLIINPLDSQS